MPHTAVISPVLLCCLQALRDEGWFRLGIHQKGLLVCQSYF